jgi:tRNA(His) 5'-end guanylyltransferase
MKDNDDFGNRMKDYEGAEAERRLIPMLPVCARLDGRCFSKFTQKMKRPYDERLSRLMIEVTKHLVKETNACIGYTQSDEISLVWYYKEYNSEMMFSRKVHKLTSILASECTAHFNWMFYRPGFFGDPGWLSRSDVKPRPAVFDCRVWQVPTTAEAANVFLWREQDATKNAISMAAQSVYSHKQLQNKNGSEMKKMLSQKDIDFNDYPSFFKRGTFVQRREKTCKLTPKEIIELPPHHAARKNPDLKFMRTEIVILEMPKFSSVKNRENVIFKREEPSL